MSNLKLNFNFKSLLILLVVVATAVSFSSCKDDKDEPKGGSTTLVGNWYFSGDGSLDYNDTFSFKSNGTVTYTYYDETATGKYTYDATAGYITIVWNDPDWGTERMPVRFLSDNVIDIDGGNYGQYTRK